MATETPENSTETETETEFETDRDVLAQLSAIREGGYVNMLDMFGVRRVAEQIGFDALIDFIDGLSRSERGQYMTALEEMAEFDEERRGR